MRGDTRIIRDWLEKYDARMREGVKAGWITDDDILWRCSHIFLTDFSNGIFPFLLRQYNNAGPLGKRRCQKNFVDQAKNSGYKIKYFVPETGEDWDMEFEKGPMEFTFWKQGRKYFLTPVYFDGEMNGNGSFVYPSINQDAATMFSMMDRFISLIPLGKKLWNEKYWTLAEERTERKKFEAANLISLRTVKERFGGEMFRRGIECYMEGYVANIRIDHRKYRGWVTMETIEDLIDDFNAVRVGGMPEMLSRHGFLDYCWVSQDSEQAEKFRKRFEDK